MVVGDELQSIYGFRHADLEVFRERRAAIDASAAGEAIPLSGNFRSRPEVIGAVNAIGERLLGDGYTPLRVGALPSTPQPPGEGPAVELLLTGRDGWDEDGIRARPGDRRPHARQPAGRGALPRRAAARARRPGRRARRRWSSCCAPSPASTPTRTRSSGRACAPTWSAAAATGPSSRSPTSARCWRRSPTRSTTRRCSGALASPACGAAPDTLWLLRAAAGRGRHIWPSARAGRRRWARTSARPRAGSSRSPPAELALLRGFARRSSRCAGARRSLSLAELIDAAVTETGYDLAVLMRPAGEARFANVRKLMRLAAEFEARRGARPARPARLPRRPRRRRRRRAGGDRGRGARRGADHDHPQRQGARVRRGRDPPPLARPAGRRAHARC